MRHHAGRVDFARFATPDAGLLGARITSIPAHAGLSARDESGFSDKLSVKKFHADGVMIVDVVAHEESLTITDAAVDGLGADAAKSLAGLSLADLQQMPLQLRVLIPSGRIGPWEVGGNVVISRNPAGTIWIADGSNEAGTKWLTTHMGDPDALAAARQLLEQQLKDTKVPKVAARQAGRWGVASDS